MFLAGIWQNLLTKIKHNKHILMIFVFVVFFQLIVLHGIPVVNVGELYFAIQVSKGYTLYSDVFSHHGPGMPYLWGGIFSLFKLSYQLIESVNFIVYGLVGVLIYKISETIMSKRASFFSVLVFIVTGRAWDAHLFYPDIYAMLFTALAVCIFIRYAKNWKIDFIIGALFAVAIAFKQNIGAFGLLAVILYIILINIKNKNLTEIFHRLAYLTFGNLIVFSLVVLYFYLNNVLPQMYYGIVTFNLKELGQIYGVPCSPTTPATFIIEAGIVGLALSIYGTRDREASSLLLLSIWSLLSLLAVIPICYAQHLVPSVAPFSVLLAYSLAYVYKTPVISNLKKQFPARYKLLIILFLVITIPVAAIFSMEIYRHYSLIEEMKSSPPSYWYSWIDYTRSNNSDIVTFIKENTRENDKIFSIPTDFSLYIATERNSIPYFQVNELFFQPHFQEKIVNVLEKDKIKYIIISKNVESTYPCSPIVYRYINQNYHLIINFNGSVLLERNNDFISTEQNTISSCPQDYYIRGVNATDGTIQLTLGERPESVGHYSKFLKNLLN